MADASHYVNKKVILQHVSQASAHGAYYPGQAPGQYGGPQNKAHGGPHQQSFVSYTNTKEDTGSNTSLDRRQEFERRPSGTSTNSTVLRDNTNRSGPHHDLVKKRSTVLSLRLPTKLQSEKCASCTCCAPTMCCLVMFIILWLLTAGALAFMTLNYLEAINHFPKGGIGGPTPNERCVFPFIHDGQRHEKCIKIGMPASWCSTTYNSDNDTTKWKYCQVILTSCGNANGARCEFPFRFHNQTYHDCQSDTSYPHITSGSGKPWCATTPDFDTDGKWGECTSHIPRNKTVC